MKVIHINTFDIHGGAARAAYRIHEALQQIGISSEMLVAHKASKNKTVRLYPVSFRDKKIKISRAILKLQQSLNPTYHSCNIFPSGAYKEINCSDAELVHFHWIADEFIALHEIQKITKPIVWTLHDMWPFCGAEHYDDIHFPYRYQHEYTKDNNSSHYNGCFDVDAWVWKRKKKHLSNNHLNFNFISPSHWMAKSLFKSKLFPKKKSAVIPNCLDVSVFTPKNKNESRILFNLPFNKNIILAGASGGILNPLKGYQFLMDSFNYLYHKHGIKNEIECVVFGGESVCRMDVANGISIVEIGKVNNDSVLAALYSAADVFVLPSIMDNLPNTVMEAMSCGTPCVGFHIGGMPDMIDHKQNGFLATPFDIAELAYGIHWVLDQVSTSEKLRNEARNKVLLTYHPHIVAHAYKELYRNVLSDWSCNRRH